MQMDRKEKNYEAFQPSLIDMLRNATLCNLRIIPYYTQSYSLVVSTCFNFILVAFKSYLMISKSMILAFEIYGLNF